MDLLIGGLGSKSEEPEVAKCGGVLAFGPGFGWVVLVQVVDLGKDLGSV